MGRTRRKGDIMKVLGQSEGNGWILYNADCVDVVSSLKDDSIHYSIFSPPFSSLYTYSASERDMGNSKDNDEFFGQFSFLIKQLHRVTKPGRLVSVHCMNIATSKVKDGHIGLKDFRGDIIREFERLGWIYHSEVCIWKDPVVAMQRTKALGLLYKQLCKDSCMSRQGIAEYLCTFRKPGDNPERVGAPNRVRFDNYIGDNAPQRTPGDERYCIDVWQRYASPVWTDINSSDTLQYRSAREHDDEKHICPLQLQVVRRGVELWSNPGDTVLSPFAGIGSEGYVSIEMKRRFVGVELKKSYYDQAVKNLRAAEPGKGQLGLGIT